jgi:Scaffold protein Nfu/NifU N terminal
LPFTSRRQLELASQTSTEATNSTPVRIIGSRAPGTSARIVGSVVDDRARDTARSEIAARGLTPQAVAHLTKDALGRIDVEKLAPVKGLLKRFFSDEKWTDDEDRALAELVGSGDGWWTYDLDGGFRLSFGWRNGTFRLDVRAAPPGDGTSDPAGAAGSPSVSGVAEEAFAGTVAPEATPNPRTIRFVTGPIHHGPSRWYESAEQADDPRVRALFDEFDDVANVLVGPDFVAVGLRRPDRWEELLVPVLRAIEATFDRTEPAMDPDAPVTAAPEEDVDVRGGGPGRTTSLDSAWRALSRLRLDQPDDLAQIVAAAASSDVAARQVAARLLIEADPEVAHDAWSRLLADPSRTVRRATLDVMVDADREELRPLLERALTDVDAWTRWKALRGLVGLGIGPSRDAVTPLTNDADFRVRLEVAAALRTSSEQRYGRAHGD